MHDWIKNIVQSKIYQYVPNRWQKIYCHFIFYIKFIKLLLLYFIFCNSQNIGLSSWKKISICRLDCIQMICNRSVIDLFRRRCIVESLFWTVVVIFLMQNSTIGNITSFVPSNNREPSVFIFWIVIHHWYNLQLQNKHPLIPKMIVEFAR